MTFSWNRLFIRRKLINGTLLLPTGDSSTISEYTYIFVIWLSGRGKLVCIVLYWGNILNSTKRLHWIFNWVDCDLKPSIWNTECFALQAIATGKLKLIVTRYFFNKL